MEKRSWLYPRVQVDAASARIVPQAGAVMLTETVRVAGVERELSRGLQRWRRPGVSRQGCCR